MDNPAVPTPPDSLLAPERGIIAPGREPGCCRAFDHGRRKRRFPGERPNRSFSRRNPMKKGTHQRARSAVTGRIITLAQARRSPSKTVVETYKTGKKGPKN